MDTQVLNQLKRSHTDTNERLDQIIELLDELIRAVEAGGASKN